jgi:hypothetical protein
MNFKLTNVTWKHSGSIASWFLPRKFILQVLETFHWFTTHILDPHFPSQYVIAEPRKSLLSVVKLKERMRSIDAYEVLISID